jgi:hypothetical protein
MQKTALAIFGALLISGSAVQMAAASPHHHHSKALSQFRGAYNQVNGPISVAPQAIDRFAPSFHSEDPTLNPPGS